MNIIIKQILKIATECYEITHSLVTFSVKEDTAEARRSSNAHDGTDRT